MREDLIRMVNQIAIQFDLVDPATATAALAGHLTAFWTPGMRAELLQIASLEPTALTETARAAAAALTETAAAAAQTVRV